MTDPVCTICGQPGYSKSVEHNNDWLCFTHYQVWLKARTKIVDAGRAAMQSMIDEEVTKSAKR